MIFYAIVLDPKVTELAERFIRRQFDERTDQLRRDITKAQNEMAVRGLGTSGPMVQAVFDLCARDIELRALIVWQNLSKVLSQAGVVLSETLGDNLKQEVSKYADAIYLEPYNCLQDVVRNAGIGTAQPLTDAGDNTLAKVNAEIDLFVLGLQRQQEAKKSQSAAVFNFYSPVGAVQTGPNASAQVFQNVSLQDREALLGAIDVLRRALTDIDRLPAHPKEEIVELVEEADAETKKPKPNSSKLISIFTVIAQAIQTVGSLKPAYDTLKAALIPFGVLLP